MGQRMKHTRLRRKYCADDLSGELSGNLSQGVAVPGRPGHRLVDTRAAVRKKTRGISLGFSKCRIHCLFSEIRLF